MFPAGSLNQAMYGPPLEPHAGAYQLVHGRVDVVDREVEDGIGRRVLVFSSKEATAQ